MKHGTRSFYVSGCRCSACKQANSRYQTSYGKGKHWNINKDKQKVRQAAYMKVYMRSWRNKHKIRLCPLWAASVRKWAKANPGKVRARDALRRARKLQATPKWLTKEQKKEMQLFYMNCPEGYHVDHIYPLKGKYSCGLHVPWNLQYLTASENMSKHNFLPV